MRGFKQWMRSKWLNHPPIKIYLPPVLQHHNYDCGAAALRAVAQYFKVGPEKESEFIKACKTDKENGTTPDNIIKAARKFGLKVAAKSEMTIDELKNYLNEEKPVICCIQAYGNKKQYDKHKSGHYVVAIGYDDDNIYFEDPSMEGRRGKLSCKDFDKRWHDKEADGKVYNHHGIAIWKSGDTEPKKPKKAPYFIP